LIEAPAFVRRNKRWIGVGIAAAALVAIAASLALDPRSPPPPKAPPAPLDSVVRVDPSSGAVVQVGARNLPLEHRSPVRMQIGEGGVWLLMSGDLFRLDPSSGRVQTSVPNLDRFGIGRAAIWASNAIPVTPTRIGTLESIDPATGGLLTSTAGSSC
jgi:hypothetical protein